MGSVFLGNQYQQPDHRLVPHVCRCPLPVARCPLPTLYTYCCPAGNLDIMFRCRNIPVFLLGALQLAGVCIASKRASIVPQATRTSIAGPLVGDEVPSGIPVVGDYAGQYRPQVHFSPPQHFMNDPNGMFRDADGTWHLYYQYNPTANVAGNQHWGHATSQDLYHWINQPIALFPPEENVFVFSGSAVVDRNNTSGFFPNQTNGVVAIYVSCADPWPYLLNKNRAC